MSAAAAMAAAVVAAAGDDDGAGLSMARTSALIALDRLPLTAGEWRSIGIVADALALPGGWTLGEVGWLIHYSRKGVPPGEVDAERMLALHRIGKLPLSADVWATLWVSAEMLKQEGSLLNLLRTLTAAALGEGEARS